MSVKSKLVLLSMIAMIGTASPAFAQSFSAGRGTGNVLPFGFQSTASQNGQMAVRGSSLHTYAMAPGAGRYARNGRSANGYNQLLMSH
jgi:hypothetical protein